MKEFFKVTTIEAVLAFRSVFAPAGTQSVALGQALGRVLAADLVANRDIPGFDRSTVDGFAVRAASTYG
ncbi:MAG: molybdopterin molybdenumtransferase MoeA, partial [Desulfobacterales bacterium]|nr:molybdopterin molybdenumtransferase MoeA [Desulfobacterales bacterium]